MDVPRVLTAGGLAVWLGVLVAAAAYVRRRMRFPKSMYAGLWGRSPGWSGAISGLLTFAIAAFFVPTVAWVVAWFTSGLVIYVLGAYVVALTVERRRAARRLGLERGRCSSPSSWVFSRARYCSPGGVAD
jgi:hypothetical protein